MMMTMNSSTNTSSKIASTPEVNISFSASTSLVTRVTSLPTGLRSKNAGDIRCRWRKISLPHVEHDLLPGPLHQVGLQKLKHKRQQQGAEVEQADLRDARRRIAAQMAGQPGQVPRLSAALGVMYVSTATFTR